MQVVILSKPGWHADQLSAALAARGHAGRVVPYESLIAHFGGGGRATLTSQQTAILDADAVLARFIPAGSLEQIIYRVDALHWIEEHGVVVMNTPRAIERSVDKFYTDARLREAAIATPETVVCEGAADAMATIRAMLADREDGSDAAVVIKPIFGSMGHGIVRVSDPDVAFRVLQPLDQINSVFYVQRAVDSGGRDIRAFVVGSRLVGAIERRPAEGDWRANVSRGGSARRVELPPAWEQLAIRAAAAIGADYAGVDLLPSSDGGAFVLEVNGIPGWQGLNDATAIDVAGAIVDHLIERVASSRAATVLRA